MQNHNLHFLLKITLVMAMLLIGAKTHAQVEFHLLTEMGTRFNDVNDSGIGITGGAFYDFSTGTLTQMDDVATGLNAINNNGDVAGSMFYDEAAFIMQPAYREDGTWIPIGWFPDAVPSESSFTTYDISSNGRYVTGQMSNGCCDFNTFLYDTQTGTLTELSDPENALAGYTVNNNGIIGGWLDQPNDSGTLRVPAYITLDGTVHLIPEGQLPTFNTNSVSGINNSNVMVGQFDGQPFMYDMNANTFTSFDLPDDALSGTFVGISENGVAIGYVNVAFEVRRAIIYHPTLGPDPLYLEDVLADFGISIGTSDELLGTAYAISDDGNYIAGWVNGPPMFASGWMINFDDMLLTDSPCSITCSSDITVSAELGEISKQVDYSLSFSCDEETPAGTELILVNGLPSGSEFPIGETVIYHELVDGDGNIMDACSFTITVEDYFCTISYGNATEPITYVEFAGIENSSTADPNAPQNEYFLDIVGEVEQGLTYPIALEGYTGGNFTNYFTVFIDWDQDGVFNTTDEIYQIGSITNSTGTDGQQAVGEIIVPSDALIGTARMRVAKNYNAEVTDPCAELNYGQTEDYRVIISEGTSGISDADFAELELYPNPVQTRLNIESATVLSSATIYDLNGRKLLHHDFDATKTTIDLSSLARGVYFVKIQKNNAFKTFKIIKE